MWYSDRVHNISEIIENLNHLRHLRAELSSAGPHSFTEWLWWKQRYWFVCYRQIWAEEEESDWTHKHTISPPITKHSIYTPVSAGLVYSKVLQIKNFFNQFLWYPNKLYCVSYLLLYIWNQSDLNCSLEKNFKYIFLFSENVTNLCRFSIWRSIVQ